MVTSVPPATSNAGHHKVNRNMPGRLQPDRFRELYIIRNTLSLEKLKYKEGDSVGNLSLENEAWEKQKKLPGVISLGVYRVNNTAYTKAVISTGEVLWCWYSNRMRGDRKNQKEKEGKKIGLWVVLTVWRKFMVKLGRVLKANTYQQDN